MSFKGVREYDLWGIKPPRSRRSNQLMAVEDEDGTLHRLPDIQELWADQPPQWLQNLRQSQDDGAERNVQAANDGAEVTASSAEMGQPVGQPVQAASDGAVARAGARKRGGGSSDLSGDPSDESDPSDEDRRPKRRKRRAATTKEPGALRDFTDQEIDARTVQDEQAAAANQAAKTPPPPKVDCPECRETSSKVQKSYGVIFECPICMTSGRDRIQLPCGHGVCSECLEKLKK
jgi:hypothetical protein